jgi:hypothetical protein
MEAVSPACSPSSIDGASELVVATNRPVTLRVNGTYQTLVAAPVSLEQLQWLIRGTRLVTLVAETGGVSDLQDLEIEGRYVRAQVIRNDAEIMLRLEAIAKPSRAESGPAFERAPSRPTPRPTPLPARVTTAARDAVANTARESVQPRAVEPTPPPQPAVSQPARAPATGPGLIDEPSEITPALVTLVRTARQHGATDLTWRRTAR